MTGYEKLKAQAAELKRTRGLSPKREIKSLPVTERYANLTTDELEHLRDKAENWLKENMNNPNFAEANRRYMAIEDVLMERNVEEALLKK